MNIMQHMKYLFYLIVTSTVSLANAGIYEDFFKAVEVDDGRGVAALLARGFDPNSPSEQGQTGLHLALRGGSLKVVEVLLAQPGLKVDAPNAAAETPLMMAALHGNLEACRKLIERGASPHRSGWSPIHYAATGPQSAIVSLLLGLGAPVDAESPNRSTPLMMAARYGSEESVRILLARGASTALRNDRDLNAADFARLAGRDALARQLEPAAR